MMKFVALCHQISVPLVLIHFHGWREHQRDISLLSLVKKMGRAKLGEALKVMTQSLLDSCTRTKTFLIQLTGKQGRHRGSSQSLNIDHIHVSHLQM